MFRLLWSIGVEWIGRKRANVDVRPLVGQSLQDGDKVKAGGYRDVEKMLAFGYK